MSGSPKFMGIIYLGIGFMFTYLAIFNVSTVGWNTWTFVYIAIAAIDIFVGIRFLLAHRGNNKKD